MCALSVAPYHRAAGVGCGARGWCHSDVNIPPVIPVKTGIQGAAQRAARKAVAFDYTPPMTFQQPRLNRRLPCVYILASQRNGTLYTGVTSNLPQRTWQHRQGLGEGFTNRYEVHHLVWYEPHENMMSAIAREKAIKKWNRAWKVELIEASNPEWRDLYEEIC